MKLTSDKIKAIREEMKISVQEFATKIGYSYTTIHNWEKENKPLSNTVQEKIKQVYADFKTKSILNEKHQRTVSIDEAIPFGYTASKLRKIRFEMGLNTESFAKILGAAGSSVNRWETGRGLINKTAASNLNYIYTKFLENPECINEYKIKSVRQPKEFYERKINELFEEIKNLKERVATLEAKK